MDNGSPVPLGESVVRAHGPHFSYHYIQDAPRSPAAAINRGVALSRGGIVGILIDGARIASPGLLGSALQGFRLHDDPIVATLGWHLGPEPQQQSALKGYDQAAEDRLLERIGWPADGYRLFEISVLAPSSHRGYFAAPPESNALFLRRSTFDDLHGFDPAFDLPGGGLLNFDFFASALARDASPLVMLLGEGTFHQIHGGASTGGNGAAPDRFPQWAEQYRRIRGRPWQRQAKAMTYLGRLPEPSLKALYDSAEQLRALHDPRTREAP
jgi:hypothetical protein